MKKGKLDDVEIYYDCLPTSTQKYYDIKSVGYVFKVSGGLEWENFIFKSYSFLSLYNHTFQLKCNGVLYSIYGNITKEEITRGKYYIYTMRIDLFIFLGSSIDNLNNFL